MATIDLNGSLGKEFKIERRVRQGCPFAPSFFLIVGEVLIHIIFKTIVISRLRGITLRRRIKQSISQYVENPSFMVRGEKSYVDELARLLKVFNEASKMDTIWDKLWFYWFDKYTHKPTWLEGYDWRWAEEGDLSKLLGNSFSLNLNTPQVDQFLYSKITKELDYWSIMKFSMACSVVICNHVLLSTLWFFITL